MNSIMKQQFLKLTKVILSTILIIQFISCNNKTQDEISFYDSESEKTLQKHANIHNFGLEYIKIEAKEASDVFTKGSLDSVFRELVIWQYGKREADVILQQIAPFKELVFSGNIPLISRTKNNVANNITDQANAFALEALRECMGNISNHLKGFGEDEIFDNKSLLNDLHNIICHSYSIYAKQCSSDINAKALSQTLGVLYGSLEYWTNSNNVEYWSKIYLEEEEKTESCVTFSATKATENEDTDDRTLSKSEWLQTVAAADAIGAATSGGALAAACSAAAALYFDVE